MAGSGDIQETARMTIRLVHSWPGHATMCGGNWPSLSWYKWRTMRGGMLHLSWAWFGTRHWIQVTV